MWVDLFEELIGYVADIVGSVFRGGKRRRSAQTAETLADDDGAQIDQQDVPVTMTSEQTAQALCAYMRQTSELDETHIENPEQFLDAHNALAGEAARWLSRMATTSQKQDYTFFGTLSPEQMRLELVLDIAGGQVAPTVADREAVEVIQAAAQTLEDRAADL